MDFGTIRFWYSNRSQILRSKEEYVVSWIYDSFFIKLFHATVIKTVPLLLLIMLCISSIVPSSETPKMILGKVLVHTALRP